MTPADASKVLNFLSKAKIDSDIMKGHIINSLNACMQSQDPASVRFCQILSESINRAATGVLTESAAPSHFQGQVPLNTLLESITDHASKLML